jgi:hypothetical protein
MDNPLVTVNILSYNRKDELRYTLQKVFGQNYKNVEVIVVDNASDDGAPEMVSKEFPDVTLIELQKNIGIAGWNEGLKNSKGEYMLVLDDDAYPDAEAIEKSINVLKNERIAACVSFNMIDSNTGKFYESNWLPNDKEKKVYYPVFIGCAFMLKMDQLPMSFTFPDDYFIYQHELPMSAEITINEKKICFAPEIIGYHNFKKSFYYNKYSEIQVFQNNLKFIIKYFPASLLLFYVMQQIIFFFTRSIRKGWFKEFIKVLREISMTKFLKNKKIGFPYFFSLRRLHLFNYRILSKLGL